jgi:hypothetical protein
MVFYEFRGARLAAQRILSARGEIVMQGKSLTYRELNEGISLDGAQAVADLVVLRDRLSDYFSEGITRRALAAALVLAGIVLTMAGAVLALATS